MSIVTQFNHSKLVVCAKPLISFISQIKSQKYKTEVDNLRYYDQNDFETQYTMQRKMIPRISIAGNFKSDMYSMELISYSGFLFIEIPYLHPKEFTAMRLQIIQNPYVFACYKNAMGLGLCFMIKSVDGLEKHQRLFRRARKYFCRMLGTKQISKDGQDVDHLVLMSSDKDTHLNMASIPFHFEAKRF